MRPATRGFIIIFSTCRTAGARGDASCPPWIAPSCWPAHCWRLLIFPARRTRKRRYGSLAEALYLRADWQWAQDGGETLTHGWKPECGFLKYRWEGYDEAMLLYVLALGSPTHPLPENSYAAWTSSYKWAHCYGYDYLYSGPLFTHQLSHVWLDFRDIQDAFMREKGIDYFENSRRATYVQRQYAIENPLDFAGYGECCWGITASDGPGPDNARVNGIQRVFFDYIGRGVPYGPDDGTIAPWAVVASLPFAPEIVLPDYRLLHVSLETEAGSPIRLQGHVQPHLSGKKPQSGRLGFALACRLEPGTDRTDDRKLSNRTVVAVDEKLPACGQRLAPCRVCRRLAGVLNRVARWRNRRQQQMASMYWRSTAAPPVSALRCIESMPNRCASWSERSIA